MLVLMLLLAGIASDSGAKLDLALAAQYEDRDTASLQLQLRAVNARIAALQTQKNLDYWGAYEKALSEGKTLIMFVGVRPRPIGHAIIGEQGDFQQPGPLKPPDYPLTCIVVAVPEDGAMYWRATLSANASDRDIMFAMAPRKVVQPAAVPFSPPPAGRDADLSRGPWPAMLPFPSGMVRYRRARFTQEIAVTNGSDRITPVPRANLESHWQVSGGMVGLEGWRSDVYRSDHRPSQWIGNIHVRNSFGFLQPNRGHQRSYPDGAAFMDVLSVDGVVFEVRQRRKVGGVWESSVLYENPKARPNGYDGKMKRSCASCHSEAGSGEYGFGLVPGGDGVLSDPFPELER